MPASTITTLAHNVKANRSTFAMLSAISANVRVASSPGLRQFYEKAVPKARQYII